jgi:hypothetical protein
VKALRKIGPYVPGFLIGWWAFSRYDPWAVIIVDFAVVGVLATASQGLKAWNDWYDRNHGAVLRTVKVRAVVKERRVWCPTCLLDSAMRLDIKATDEDGMKLGEYVWCPLHHDYIERPTAE